MSNISEQYRKPLMTDETGKAIANKLGGNSNASQGYNTSEFYRKPLMTDETAQLILAKIDGGGSGGASALSELSDVNLTSPSDGQVLHYDGTEWINATPVAELPAVTSDDNGDVLTVVEGAWAKASAGGEKVFYFNAISTNTSLETNSLVSISTTKQEIMQKLNQGYKIIVNLSGEQAVSGSYYPPEESEGHDVYGDAKFTIQIPLSSISYDFNGGTSQEDEDSCLCLCGKGSIYIGDINSYNKFEYFVENQTIDIYFNWKIGQDTGESSAMSVQQYIFAHKEYNSNPFE